MPAHDKDLIRTIEHTCGAIDSLGLNDAAAWQRTGEELAAALEAMDATRAAETTLARACVDALTAMARKTVSEPLQVCDALAEALVLLKTSLAAPASRQAECLQQARRMAALLAPERPAAPCLDDAAMLLVQLEADDADGWRQLKSLLGQVLAAGATVEDVAEGLTATIARIEQVVEGGEGDPEALLAEIGGRIETWMHLGEMPPAAQSAPPGAPEPDLQHAAAGPAGEPETAQAVEPDPAPEPPPPAAVEREDWMPEDPDQELLQEYVAESRDLIVNAEEALLTLENDPENGDAVATVFRAFHSVKGTSAFLELTIISELGHHAETLLSRVRDGEIRYGGGYADLALRALDMIKELITGVQEALGGAQLRKPQGYDDLLQLLADPDAAGISDEWSDADSAARIGDILVAQGKVEREAVEAAARGCEGQRLGSCLVKSKAASLEDVGRALRTQKRMQGQGQPAESSVRVSTGRLDRLIDMVGEMVIAHSMVAQDEQVIGGGHYELNKKVGHVSKIVRELQDLSMSMRMVPLKGTFRKMTRLVRDLARKVGKKVELVTEGEDTEIDRNLVDVINDPLVHMIRNAVDHGIESPEARQRAGKPAHGTIRLSAYHSAGKVVVEIIDDGRGLDREAILAKARQRGLLAEDQSPAERELYNLIFEPGFSTAREVTDVSGRGVGMDVVKRNIESLRGQVEVHSDPGRGSVFKVSLPLTLAIIDGMVVRVGREVYVIPTVSILSSIKPEPGDITTVHGRGEMLALQGRLIPLVRLGRLYGLADSQQDLDRALVVVVEEDARQVGFVIDELVGRQQVVIKSLGEKMQNISGISGGAIMPNGRVGLILDVGGVIKLTDAETDTGEVPAAKVA